MIPQEITQILVGIAIAIAFMVIVADVDAGKT